MIVTLIVCATVVLLAVGARLTFPRSLIKSRLRSRVVVTLKSGASFDGVLYAADSHSWVLRSAHALDAGDGGASVPVDGELLILVADIEFAQKP